MRLNRFVSRSLLKQQGALLITSIVIMVLFSLLSAAMVSLIRVGDTATAQEVISMRALMSAQSGANRYLNCLAETGVAATCTSCGANTIYNWPNSAGSADDGLAGCIAAITCRQLCDTSGTCVLQPGMGNYFDISVQGQCGPAANVARRTVDVRYGL